MFSPYVALKPGDEVACTRIMKDFYVKGTHNQCQSLQTQIIKSLFPIQICSI